MRKVLATFAVAVVWAAVGLVSPSSAYAVSCPSTANQPYISNNIIGGYGYVSCTGYVSNLYLEVCLQTFDYVWGWVDMNYPNACAWNRIGSSGYGLLHTYDCAWVSGTLNWRTRAYANGWGGASSDACCSVPLNC